MKERFRLIAFAGAEIQHGKVVQVSGYGHLIFAGGLLADFQGTQQRSLGLGEITADLIMPGQVLQTQGDARMFRT